MTKQGESMRLRRQNVRYKMTVLGARNKPNDSLNPARLQRILLIPRRIKYLFCCLCKDVDIRWGNADLHLSVQEIMQIPFKESSL